MFWKWTNEINCWANENYVDGGAEKIGWKDIKVAG